MLREAEVHINQGISIAETKPPQRSVSPGRLSLA